MECGACSARNAPRSAPLALAKIVADPEHSCGRRASHTEDEPMYEVPTGPQSIGGVLDSGFRLYKASLGRTFALALVASLLFAPVNRLSLEDFGDAAGFWLAGILVGVFATLVLYGAIIARIAAVANGGDIATEAALAIGLRRSLILFLAYFAYLLATLGGLLLLIIPGIYLMVSLAFGMFAVIVDRKGPIASLSYSHQTVRGHWWRTAGLLTIIGVMLLAFTVLVTILTTLPIFMNPQPVFDRSAVPWYIDYIVSPLLSGVFTPLWCALFLAAFSDLKLRHEGGDLAARIAAAAAA
jgi:hypothetical protein